MRDCPHAINAVKAATRKLEFFAKKRTEQPAASSILFELCTHLDAMNSPHSTPDGSDTDDAEPRQDHCDDIMLFDAHLASSNLGPVSVEGGPSRKSEPGFSQGE